MCVRESDCVRVRVRVRAMISGSLLLCGELTCFPFLIATLRRAVCARYSHFSEFVPHLLEDGTPKDYQQVYDDLYGDGGVDSAAAAAEEGGEEDGAEDDEDGEGEDKDAFESRRLLQNPRFYTPRETARLMGFPEDFQVVNTMKDAACNNRIYYQLGNAVVPPVIQALVQAIVDTDVYTAAPALP